MERNDYLIRKAINKYMITGIMTTVALQLGNVVDAMIVGNLIGSLGNGAVSGSTPYIYILEAAAILLGSGGALTMAVFLGKRDTRSSGHVMGFCILIGVIYPVIFTCLSPLTVPAFVKLSGATGELASMMNSVTTVYSLGMPVISFMLVMAYLMNVDNHPALSAKMHITANAVNLVLDFLLVKFTPLGISGAALSTVLGYLAALLIFVPRYFRSPARMVKPEFKEIFRHKDLIKATIKNGFPNLAYLIMTVISVSVINAGVLRELGDSYFSAYAVVNNTQLFVQMILNGISSVIASVAGVLYGEKDYFGMRHVFRRVLRSALIVGIVIMLIFILVPQAVAGMYGFNDEAVRPELLAGLRIFSLSFLFFILNAISQNYYRTIGQTFLSTASSAMQLLLFKIPFMLIGGMLFGFKGLFIGVILSEFLSFAVLNMIRILLQKNGKVPKSGFMAIPKTAGGELCDLTIKGTDKDAVIVAEKIMDFCKKENISEEKAMALTVASEEIAQNIGRYGYKDAKDAYIDVCLTRAEDKYILRFRDNGIPFDPVSYEPGEHDEYDVRGLDLIRKLAVKMKYLRALNLNNTIIELDMD